MYFRILQCYLLFVKAYGNSVGLRLEKIAVTKKFRVQIPVFSAQFLVERCHQPTFVMRVLILVVSNVRCMVPSSH